MTKYLHNLFYFARQYSWLWDIRRLWGIPEYVIDRPIFLLGTQGGGLTLLSRMLRRNPLTISSAGNSSYWTSADEMQNVFGLILPFDLTGVRYKAPFHPVLTAPRGWTYASDELFDTYRKRAADATPTLRKALQWTIRFAAHRYARDRQNFRFVDKSQVYTVRLGLIYELLKGSDPRFVLVARDPYVSVFRAASGKPRSIARLVEKVSYKERLKICAQHFGNSVRAVFEDQRQHRLNIHQLRFEDLLDNPERSLRDVCSFVDLDFIPNMLPLERHKMPLGTRHANRWHPIRTGVNIPYEEKLDSYAIQFVNRYCGDLIERIGYPKRG